MDSDAELRLLNEVLRGCYGIRRRDRVLDIGCGAGQTTREVAGLALEGRALGVDRSAEAIARARELARAEGVHNATFEYADAQTYPFASEDFDVVISRFGTMFFREPVAAFANIGRALRPAGRLVMMVWQGHEQNEWSLAIEEALGACGDEPTSEASDTFSLANPVKTEEILDATGFAHVAFIDVQRPIYFGRDVEDALEWVNGFACTRESLVRLGPPSAERALGHLRKTLAAHAAGDGVWFDARAWIVKARRG